MVASELERRTRNGLRQNLFAGAVLLLLSAIVAAVWSMRGDTSAVRNEVSLYAIQLKNTEQALQLSLAAHVSLGAHKDAGARIREVELALKRIETELKLINRRLDKLDKYQ